MGWEIPGTDEMDVVDKLAMFKCNRQIYAGTGESRIHVIGYALSPADMTDIIFAFYIEHNHFDVIDIDIQLEEHGLPCIIS